MKTIFTGRAFVFGKNIDTDQIYPGRFVELTEEKDIARHAMEGADPGFVKEFKRGDFLVAATNFGCGSSREHAPWALDDYGFRVIIACSFADIFYNNCFKNGMLPIALPEADVEILFQRAAQTEGYQLTVDLENCTISDGQGLSIEFEVDDFRRKCLLEGLDDIGLTLQHEDKITTYEKAHGIA